MEDPLVSSTEERSEIAADVDGATGKGADTSADGEGPLDSRPKTDALVVNGTEELDPIELLDAENDSFGNHPDDNNSDVWKGSDSEEEISDLGGSKKTGLSSDGTAQKLHKDELKNGAPVVGDDETVVNQGESTKETESELTTGEEVVEKETESRGEVIEKDIENEPVPHPEKEASNEKEPDGPPIEKGPDEPALEKEDTVSPEKEASVAGKEADDSDIEDVTDKNPLETVEIEDTDTSGKEAAPEEGVEKADDNVGKGAGDKNDIETIDKSNDDSNKENIEADQVTLIAEDSAAVSKENGTSEGTQEPVQCSSPVPNEDIPMDYNNEDMDDNDDFDPSLLCPEVSMAVDENPMVTMSENGPNDGSVSPIPMFSTSVDEVTGAEISFNLTTEEQELKQRMYGERNPIQFTKIHCTACSVHLGSALEGRNNRFVHPLLKVIICKKCYHFYTSGEFEKDEDGSELYCRWCGQGGQVLCCSKCEFVFCKKCIRSNFNQKKLTDIKESDEWDCFRCNSTQLILQRVACAAFFDYVQRERIRASTLNDPQFMKIDHSRCCSNAPPVTKKRPLEDAEENKNKKKRKKTHTDPDYDPLKERPPVDPLSTTTTTQAPPPVPSTSNARVSNPTPILPKPPPIRYTPGPYIKHVSTDRDVQFIGHIPAPTTTLPHLVMNPLGNTVRATRPRYQVITSALNAPRPQGVWPQNVVRISGATFRGPPPLTPASRPLGGGLLQERLQVGQQQNKGPPGRAPNAHVPKHEWFEKTVRATARVTSHLSYTLTQLNKSQSQAGSVEELAIVHNKLQEILSSSINSLIQVRKNLRSEFIAGIKTVRFPPKTPPTRAPEIQAPLHFPHANNTDDDVIFVSQPQSIGIPSNPILIVQSPSSSMRSTMTEPTPSTSMIPMANAAVNDPKPKGPYLKVKSFNDLQNVTAECIVIPDEPPRLDESFLNEKDPLAMEPNEEPLHVNDRETTKDPTTTKTTKERNEKTTNGKKTNEKEQNVVCNGNAAKKPQNKEKSTPSKTVSVSSKHESFNVKEKPSPKIKHMQSVVVKLRRDDLKRLQESFSKRNIPEVIIDD